MSSARAESPDVELRLGGGSDEHAASKRRTLLKKRRIMSTRGARGDSEGVAAQ
jgi:hypothetical protein